MESRSRCATSGRMRSTFRRRRITSGLLQKENASAPSGLGPVAKAHRGFGGVHGLRTTIRAHPSTATATAPSPRCETLGTTCAPHTGIDNLRPVHTGSKATYAALPPRRAPAAVLVSVLGLVTSLLLGTATHTDAATPPAQSVPIQPQQPYQPPPPGQGVLPPPRRHHHPPNPVIRLPRRPTSRTPPRCRQGPADHPLSRGRTATAATDPQAGPRISACTRTRPCSPASSARASGWLE